MVIFHSYVSLPERITDWTIYRGVFFPWGQLVILSAGEEALQKEAVFAPKDAVITLWCHHGNGTSLSMAISGTDWLEVPTIYKAYKRPM